MNIFYAPDESLAFLNFLNLPINIIKVHRNLMPAYRQAQMEMVSDAFASIGPLIATVFILFNATIAEGYSYNSARYLNFPGIGSIRSSIRAIFILLDTTIGINYRNNTTIGISIYHI